MNDKCIQLNAEKVIKKRIPSIKWAFTEEQYEHSTQLTMIQNISTNNIDSISKTAVTEIHRKMSSYKQQDKLKKLFDESKFLTFDAIIHKMLECNLKCRYCEKEMFVLYDVSREGNQWSVDRIDNYTGHNIDNFHLACLTCNLKRRRRTDEKFLFTKQLKIIKLNN